MKIRKSFFIRWLTATDKSQNQHSVIDIEYVQTGDKRRVSSLEEAGEWMKSAGVSSDVIQEKSADETRA